MVYDNTILEPVLKEIFEAKREGRKVLRIHVAYKFNMRVKKQCSSFFVNFNNPDNLIFGLPVAEHVEPCEKEWWLEFEGDGRKSFSVNDIFKKTGA